MVAIYLSFEHFKKIIKQSNLDASLIREIVTSQAVLDHLVP